MKKAIAIYFLDDWVAAITAHGDDLYIKVEGLSYIYDSIKKRGVEDAKQHSGLLKALQAKDRVDSLKETGE